MNVTRSHKIALRPTAEQEQQLRRAAGVSRFTWNWALAEWNRQHQAGEKPSAMGLKKQFNAVKGESRDAFYVANHKFRVDGKTVALPRIGKVKMREALRLKGKATGATVSRTADRWFVAIGVEVDLPVARCETQARTVGVDLGISRLATLSDGTVIAGPKPLRSSLKRLARLNRCLHRRLPGSRNCNRMGVRVARCHARISDIRGDALHKLTTRLVRTYGRVVIEDLNVRGMVRNRKLSRAISDMGLGEFRRQLSYKAVASLAEVVVADRWFPSSRLCVECGTLHDALTLKDRTFTCDCCGHAEDRDVHAARNLERYPGLQGNPDACGHLSAGQPDQSTGETRVDEAGIHACNMDASAYL